MLTKSIGAYADEIIAELGYQTVEKKLDRRNVIVRMDSVRSELMGILLYSGTIQSGQTSMYVKKGSSFTFPDNFYISRSSAVIFDTTRLRYYSDMPTEWVSFDGNNGIRLVRLAQDNQGNYFISQRNGSSSLYGELESAALGGNIGYEIEGSRLYYNNMPANQYTEVLITYIPTLTALSESDTLPCDGTFASILMDKTREAFLIQKATAEDKSIDGGSN